MVNMVKVPHTAEISCKDWFGNAALDTAVSEALQRTLADNAPRLSFPFEWFDGDGRGGPPVTPLTVYVSFPVSQYEDEEPEWSCNLEDEIEDFIDLHSNPLTGLVDSGDGISVMNTMAVAFEEMANRLRNAIDPKSLQPIVNQPNTEAVSH